MINYFINVPPSRRSSRLLLLCLAILLSFTFQIKAQNQDSKFTVEGTVKDSSGEPLIGVVVKTDKQTTATDLDGFYKLQTTPLSKITFTYMGMESITEAIDNRSVINAMMKENSVALDDVVVTALGIKRQEKALGYAVQKVNPEDLTTVKGTNIATSLSGKIAGVLVKNSTDFGKDADFLVRGVKPLLVVNGVPVPNMSLSEIPADDIEDISVLKGATASALYGSDGGNGALMITTKKGSKDKGYTISVNSNTMFSAGYIAMPEKQSVFGRGTTGVYDINADRVWGQVMDGTSVNQWNPISKQYEMQPYLAVGKNNFKNFVNTSIVTNNNISIANGNENGNFRVSGTWIYNKGQYPNNEMNRFNFGVSGDMKVGKLDLAGSMTYNKYHSPNEGFNGYKNYDPMYSLLIWTGADYDIRDYKDNIWVVPGEVQNNSYDRTRSTLDNAYFLQYGRTNSVDKDIVNASFSMTYNIEPWLKAIVRSGLNFRSTRQHTRVSQGALAGTGEDYWWQPKLTGMYATRQNSMWDTNNDLMFIADQRFGDFTVDGVLGGSIYYFKEEYQLGRTNQGISLPEFFSLKASNLSAMTESYIKSKRKNGVYGKVGGSWRSMLFLEATFRNDWSSTLSKDNRSFFYPSVAGSFVVSELFEQKSWLDIWKLRGSWTVSKKEPAIFENNVEYTVATNQWGDRSSAYLPTKIRPSNLKPVQHVSTEFGTMASFLNGRLNVDFAYYTILEKDRILSTSISPASGYAEALVNTKENITRRGFELTIGGNIVTTKDLLWRMSTNWTRYADYYTSIDDQYSSTNPWVKKGKRADAFTLNDFERSPSGAIVHDNQGKPKYMPHKSVYGYSNPDWVWGVSSLVKYKNLTFSLSVDGRIGGLTPSITEAYLWLSGSHPNSVIDARYDDVANALNPVAGYKGTYVGEGVKVVSGEIKWDPQGNVLSDTRVFADNDTPIIYRNYIDGGSHKNFIWGGDPSPLDVYSTTFLKLREISVTYDLPQSFTNKFSVKNASVSLVGQNVLMWAKDFKYSDPDGGTENFSSPSARYVGFNLKVDF